MMRRGRQSAMTLLEVILAVSLSAGVLGSAMVFYDHAVDVRTCLEAEMRVAEARRLIMDRITNDLRAAMASRFLGIGMEGASGEMRFVSSAIPGPAVWAVRKSTEDPIPPEHDLRIIGYRLRQHEDEQTGELLVDGLERTCQKLLAVQQAEEGDEIEPTLLSRDIKFIAFLYWQRGIWLESWGGGDLPVAVEITMGFEPLPEDTAAEEYPYPVFRRLVYLPGAAQGRRRTVIRGLAGGSRP